MFLKKTALHRSNTGFTLVELMIVVAMVGVLSAIAIPNYHHHTAKARQAEAKIALSAMYIAELNYYSEFGSYTMCIRQAGYVPDSSVRYYLVGSATYAHTMNTCGPTGNNDCRKVKFTNTADCATANPDCCNALDFNGSNTTPQWPAPIGASDIMYSATASADANYKPMYGLFVGPSSGGGIGLDTKMTRDTFVLGAAGCVFPIRAPNYWTSPVPNALRSTAHAAAAFDGWIIDQNKKLSNPNPGA
ncbi:MAG: type IV pilin protein [Bdellovibrionia bacterium]